MLNFPNIKPHFFQIKQLPDYGLNVEVLESLKEKRYNILIGNNLIINFQYNGINTEKTINLFNFYTQTKGGLTSFKIANNLLTSDNSIHNIINKTNPEGLWRFNTAIQSKTQFYSLHDLTFDLKGVTE